LGASGQHQFGRAVGDLAGRREVAVQRQSARARRVGWDEDGLEHALHSTPYHRQIPAGREQPVDNHSI
jgi:hypothetical protein